jgi:hypothetical protein
MMSAVKIILFLILILSSLDADKKWISLKAKDKLKQDVPIKQKPQQINLNKIKPIKAMMQRVQIARYFLEKTTIKKEIKAKKNWFVLKDLNK